MARLAANVRDMRTDELMLRLHQQGLVASFGLFALAGGTLEVILAEACRAAADGLHASFSKVLHYRAASNDLLVVAGIGWREGTVGHSTLGAGLSSPAGFALQTGEPVLSNNLSEEARFWTPVLLSEHGILSAINVKIGAEKQAFGVLEVDSTLRGDFLAEDTAFLQSLANVLAAAISRAKAEQAKDTLLQEKDLLMQEVHHRVKNSLQMVKTLLQLQARSASDETREQLEEAAGRIMTIGVVHQRLYEGGSVTHTDAAVYLQALCADMQALLGCEGREIVVNAAPLMLAADHVTPLGLVVSELVTNAFKHGAGKVTVSLVAVPKGLQVRVEDGGSGFPDDVEPTRPAGLGLRLIRALAKGNPDEAVVIDRTVPNGAIMVTLTQ